MQIGIDAIAIAIMESLAVAVFMLTIMFMKKHRKIIDKLETVTKSDLDERGDEECWSYRWVMKNITMPRRSIWHPGLFGVLFAIMGALVVAAIFALIVLTALDALGYAPLLILLALTVISDPEAYQAYSYVNAVTKVSPDHLTVEDEEYMRIAREDLRRKMLRFLTIAIVFAILGPFIPLIFEWLTHTFKVYVTFFFKATAISGEISNVLSLVIILVGPGLLVFFPEFVLRKLLKVTKNVIAKIRKRG